MTPETTIKIILAAFTVFGGLIVCLFKYIIGLLKERVGVDRFNDLVKNVEDVEEVVRFQGKTLIAHERQIARLGGLRNGRKEKEA